MHRKAIPYIVNKFQIQYRLKITPNTTTNDCRYLLNSIPEKLASRRMVSTLGLWMLGLWTLGLWTPGHLDSGQLDAWTLDDWMLHLDSRLLDAWMGGIWMLDRHVLITTKTSFNNYMFATKEIL